MCSRGSELVNMKFSQVKFLLRWSRQFYNYQTLRKAKVSNEFGSIYWSLQVPVCLSISSFVLSQYKVPEMAHQYVVLFLFVCLFFYPVLESL